MSNNYKDTLTSVFTLDLCNEFYKAGFYFNVQDGVITAIEAED